MLFLFVFRDFYIILYRNHIFERGIFMFTKFKNHCKKPITWGAYYKLCGISFLASLVMGGACIVKYVMDMKSLEHFDYPTEEDFSEEES